MSELFAPVRGWPSYWADLMTQAVRGHWAMLDVGYRLTSSMWEATLPLLTTRGPEERPGTETPEPVAAAEATTQLVERATNRLAKGLAPPREIYQVQNRSRIDWLQVPDWARPADPEMFEGCGHEG
jgi:hypothetical protein